MRLPLTSWKKTLNALGMKLVERKAPPRPKHRFSSDLSLESLEVRQMLSMSPADDPRLAAACMNVSASHTTNANLDNQFVASWSDSQPSASTSIAAETPAIGGFSVGSNPSIRGADVTLTATNVTGNTSGLSVDFYHDANHDGQFDATADTWLGADADPMHGWSLTVSTSGYPEGVQTYFAVATNGAGQTSSAATTSGTIGAVAILDNAQPGYSEVGSGWTASPDGVDGASRQHAASDGEDSAHWTFTGLADESFRAQATWTAGTDRATDATYRIYDGNTLIDTVHVNQQLAPQSETVDGVNYETLGSYHFHNGALTVELATSGTGSVSADAVRLIDPPPTVARLSAYRNTVVVGQDVLLTASDVADSDGTIAQVKFYRDSDTSGTLNTGVDEYLGNDTSDAGGWTYNVDTSGYSAGDETFFAVAIDNDTLSSDPVVATAKITTGVGVDDGDADYSEAGTWANLGDGYNSQSRYASGGSGANTATWDFDSLDMGQQYEVFVTHTPGGYWASNAPFTVSDGSSALATVLVNQRETPHDGTFDGAAWESLGVFSTGAGTTLSVTLNDDADGTVIADGVRLMKVPAVAEAPSIVDDVDTAYAEATSSQWRNVEGGYQGNSRYHDGTNSVNDKADWTFDEMAAGKYELFATWTPGGYAASNTEYSIYDGATLLRTVRINQRETAHDGTYNGVAWESLGVYDLSDPTLRVEITTNNADGYIIADAVRWEAVPEVTEAPTVLDDVNTAYSEATSTQWRNVEGGYQGNSRYHDGTNSVDDKASWTFEEMESGKYELFATWTPGGYAASNTEYSIYDGATLLKTVRINQRETAHDGTFDGVAWESLGVYDLSDPTLRIEITTNNADGYIIADAVRWEAVPEVTEAPTVLDDVSTAYSEATSTQWRNVEGGYQGNSRYHDGTNSVDDKANWTFEEMESGKYELFTTWTPGGYAASNVEYSIYDGATARRCSAPCGSTSARPPMTARSTAWLGKASACMT